ncbi:MAG: HypC/HybG/HupF family hydrogenase formation chaperone [Solirubrobacterales bacterium]
MRIERIDRNCELALCATGEGERQSVEIALVQPVGEGDTVLVHAGTAIARVAEGVGV